MKIFGSSKSSRHTGAHAAHSGGRRQDEYYYEDDYGYAAQPGHRAAQHPSSHGSDAHHKKRRAKRRGNAVRALVIILAVVAAVGATGAVMFMQKVAPPTQIATPNKPSNNTVNKDPLDETSPGGDTQTQTPGSSDTAEPPEEDNTRTDTGTYTFLAVGKDRVASNTDTIMVATFDTSDYSLNVVSIPRDTLVNVSTRSKKVNALYANGGEEGLMEGIADLIGFRPDFYGIINLDAFIELIDAIGGVDYYVPQNMDYDDPYQDLHIHFKKGMTHMTGQKAMEYMRFRKGYANQDIGRIDAQQNFLLTAAQQILENKSSVPITTLVNIFISDVKTSLSVTECTWFAKELLKMDFENIHFYTMPGYYNDYVHGTGYVVLYLDEWLQMINQYLNPFDKDLTEKNLDVLTRDGKSVLYASSGVIQDKSWRSSTDTNKNWPKYTGKSTSTGSGTTSKPSTSTPSKTDTSKPDTTKPETTKPETTTPDTTKPDTSQPGTTTPDTDPEVTPPDTEDPGTGSEDPGTENEGGGDPSTDPGGGELPEDPDQGQTGGGQPEEQDPGTGEPAPQDPDTPDEGEGGSGNEPQTPGIDPGIDPDSTPPDFTPSDGGSSEGDGEMGAPEEQ